MKQAVQLPIHWILYPPTHQKKINTVKVLVLSVELKTENKIQLNQCIMKALEPLMIIIGHNKYRTTCCKFFSNYISHKITVYVTNKE